MGVQEWLDAISVADVITGVIWIGVVIVGVRWVKPIALGLRDIVDDWRGRPARFGFPAVPGMMERISSLSDEVSAHTVAIEEIRHQVTPNTGTSAHDALMRGQAELRELVVELMADMGTFRRQYADDLHHNHPGYQPRQPPPPDTD